MSDDAELYNEFRKWRLTVRADWEAFMEYRDMKAKAEAFERTTGSIGPAEEGV